MARRRQRVEYELDIGNISQLAEYEIINILRAADELIGCGGRNMLAKTLKGSKDKKILEHGMDKCPAYGYYKDLKLEEIMYRVDWCIRNHYLEITYDYGKLPFLKFSPLGWEIEKETFSQELYSEMVKQSKRKTYPIVKEMEKVNRQVKFRMIDIAEEKGDEKILPVLEAWKITEVKKIRASISKAQDTIRKRIE